MARSQSAQTAKVRTARRRYEAVAKANPPGPGSGRAAALEAVVAAGGAKNPGAVIGMIGRKAHGAAAMARWSAAGRHRAAAARRRG